MSKVAKVDTADRSMSMASALGSGSSGFGVMYRKPSLPWSGATSRSLAYTSKGSSAAAAGAAEAAMNAPATPIPASQRRGERLSMGGFPPVGGAGGARG